MPSPFYLLLPLLLLSTVQSAPALTMADMPNITIEEVVEDPYKCWQNPQCDKPTLEAYELMAKYKGNTMPEADFWKLNGLLETVMTCLKPNPCSEIKDYRRTFYLDQVEQWLRFTRLKEECLPKMFQAVYDNKYECTKKFNFLERNSTIKYDIFTKGINCFLDIATQECSNITVTFLYRSYLDIMIPFTMWMDYDECSSPYDDVTKLQCQPMLKDLEERKKELTEGDPRTKEVLELCREAEKCVDDSCRFDKDFKKGLGCDSLELPSSA